MWDQEITPLKKSLSVKSRKFSVIAELVEVSLLQISNLCRRSNWDKILTKFDLKNSFRLWMNSNNWLGMPCKIHIYVEG